MEWRNWDGRVRCRPAQWAVPATEAELAEQVAAWAQAGRRIRVAGSGHSFTPLAASDDVLLSLQGLRGLSDIDRLRNEVEVWAGTPLHELGRLLAQQGLAQENLGDIDAQTLPGAIATGTHGTGAALGSLSTQVSGFTLLAADGTLRQVAADSEPELFAAGRVSLGALGILTRIRLKLRPAYRLHLRVQRGTLDQCLAEAQAWADGHRNFEFFWFPGTPYTLLKFADETTAPVRPRSRWQRRLDEVLETGVFGALSELARAVPAFSPLVAQLAGRFVGTSDTVDAAHRIYPTARRVRFHEMEYALPRQNLVPALEAIRRQLGRARYRVFFPLECRFTAADDIWLSPAYRRDSAYIAVHMYRGMPFERYFRDLEAILREHQGRPHWGKWHSLAAAELAELYPRWAEFQALRQRLDPTGVFLNPYLCRLFGADQPLPAGSKPSCATT